MAEGLFKSLLAQRGLQDGWQVSSAGTLDEPSMSATPEARQAAAELGADIRKHRSRQITKEILDHSDLILVMTHDHQELLNEVDPTSAERTFLLSQMAGIEQDVEDPIGFGFPVYQGCARQIQAYLDQGFNVILELAQAPRQP